MDTKIESVNDAARCGNCKWWANKACANHMLYQSAKDQLLIEKVKALQNAKIRDAGERAAPPL